MSHSESVRLCGMEIQRLGAQFMDLLQGIEEEGIWEPGPGGSNSIGVLCAHIAGNLRHYLGAGILADGFQRDRSGEFSRKRATRAELRKELREALDVAQRATEGIAESRAGKPHTTPCGQRFESLAYHVARLTTHLAYHLGQADYASRKS